MDKINIFKGLIDWYSLKSLAVKNTILISLITCFFAFNYFSYTQEEKNKSLRMEEQIYSLQKEVLVLRSELEESKTSNILVKATSDYLPIPTWLTDLKGNLLWVNRAFENKYIKPKGLLLSEVIGTDGSKIFGEEKTKVFLQNNIIVISSNRPLTFNEIEVTTKFPVKIGDYIYAVGGIEYVKYTK